MNKEIKARWINALLSGEYEQGKGFLRSPEGEYCCLGVLCDLYSKDTGIEWGKGRSGANTMHGLDGMTSNEVDRWAGFVESTQYTPELSVETYDILSTLADMNDEGATFKQIVDVIEEKL